MVGGNDPIVGADNIMGPPPYIDSPWNVGYSTQNPLKASMLNFDSESGLLIADGVPIGTYIVSIETSEYRAGELLAKSRRTFLLHFLSCGGESLDMEVRFDNSTSNPNSSPIILGAGENLCFDLQVSSPDSADFISLRSPTNSLPIDINPSVGTQPLVTRVCYSNIDDLNAGECGLIIIEASSATYCPGLTNSAIVLQVCKSSDAISSVELKNELSEQLQLYPNPGKDELGINFRSVGILDYSIKIWNSQGKLMYESTHQDPLRLNTHEWPAGLYHVQVEHEGKYGIKSWLKF